MRPFLLFLLFSTNRVKHSRFPVHRTIRCLPCKACQNHYDAFCKTRPPALIGTRTEAFDWIFDLHNDINKRLGKSLVPRDAYVTKRRADAVGIVILKDTFL